MEGQVLHEELVPKRFGQAAGLDDLVSKARAVGNGNVESGVLFLGALGKHALVVVDAGFVFGATPFGALANPVELAVEFFPALALVLLFLGQTLALLLQPRRVIALVGNALASVEFENPSRHVVEEVAVVRHTQHRALVLFEVLLQPIDGFRVEVVGRLVQQQDVRLLKQQATQGHPTALSPTQLRNLLVVWRAAKSVHGNAQLGVELPRVEGIDFVLDGRLTVHELLHFVRIVEDFLVHELHVDLLVLLQHVHNFLRALLHDFADCLGFVQFRLL